MKARQIFNHYKEDGKFNSEGTKRKYISLLQRFINIYEEVSIDAIYQHLNNELKDNAASTRNVFISAIKHFNEYVRLVYDHKYFVNEDLKLFKNKTISNNAPLSPHDRKLLWSVLPSMSFEHRFIITALLTTGIRANQMEKINWVKLYNKKKIILQQGKGNKDRWIFNNDILNELLVAAADITIYYDKVYNAVKALKKKMGLPKEVQLTPHTLRYTYATTIFERGGWSVLPYLQQLLGHASIDQTLEYVKLSTFELERVNQLQFMDEFDALDELEKDEQIIALKKRIASYVVKLKEKRGFDYER